MNKPSFCIEIPPKQKGWLLNLFNLAVRDGEKEPSRVIFNVGKRVEKYLTDPYVSCERVELLKTFSNHLNTPEATEYAKYVLGYESLPLEHRHAIKAERAEEHKQNYFLQQPATERQINYLRNLGYRGEITSKKQACDLINKIVEYTANCSKCLGTGFEKVTEMDLITNRKVSGVRRCQCRIQKAS